MKQEIKIISNVEKFLKCSLEHKAPYLVEVRGISLWVHPQVISPKYSYAPQFIVDHWDIKKGMSVLDVGTGSGILAIFAALYGASKVVGVDINQYAVETAKKNVKLNQLNDRVEIVESDVYANVGNKLFDRVIFNAPYWNRKDDPNYQLTYGVYDLNYQSTKKFLNEAKKYLAPKGKILLGFARQDDIQLMEEIISDAGLKIDKIVEETKGHTRVLYYLSTRSKQ